MAGFGHHVGCHSALGHFLFMLSVWKDLANHFLLTSSSLCIFFQFRVVQLGKKKHKETIFNFELESCSAFNDSAALRMDLSGGPCGLLAHHGKCSESKVGRPGCGFLGVLQ